MYRLNNRLDWRSVLVLALLLMGGQNLFAAGLIKAKAVLAPVLIGHAWDRTVAGGGLPVKPWPWADTWPVARLQVPGAGIRQYVLAGDSGNALAFGPGHSLASAPLGSHGQAVIGGHRDTHFAFLRELPASAKLQLQLPSGRWRQYRVTGRWVVDAEQESLAPDLSRESLLLVTCYPFDSLLAGGPLRYVVHARALTGEAQNPAAIASSTEAFRL
jgi:sortase A